MLRLGQDCNRGTWIRLGGRGLTAVDRGLKIDLLNGRVRDWAILRDGMARSLRN